MKSAPAKNILWDKQGVIVSALLCYRDTLQESVARQAPALSEDDRAYAWSELAEVCELLMVLEYQAH